MVLIIFFNLVDHIEISELRNYMHKKKDDDNKLWERIKDVMAKTLLSGIDNLKRYSQKIKISDENDIMKNNNCFELIGIDVLVDTDLNPWLLEVNPDPDLTAKDNFPIAKEIKADLLVCTFTHTFVKLPHQKQEEAILFL